MSELSKLPNVGKVLEDALLQIGVHNEEELCLMGAKTAFIKIREQVDEGACLHMLYGIEGGIEGVRDNLLTDEVKQDLKQFFKNL